MFEGISIRPTQALKTTFSVFYTLTGTVHLTQIKAMEGTHMLMT